MAKIVIYEDRPLDLLSRYGQLVFDHDVHVRFLATEGFYFDYARGLAANAGFDPEQFVRGVGIPKDEIADVYFLDDLQGQCFSIIPHLPKDRAFINSSSTSIREYARRRGYNLAKGIGTVIHRV